MTDRADWIWMPHVGHFCMASQCIFRLNTCVGNYIVSTVGEYFPDAPVREIKASVRNIKLEGMGDARADDYMKKIGYDDFDGYGNLYETMVFPAIDNSEKYKCCSKVIDVTDKKETKRYKTAGEAYKGHIKLCLKWSRRK